MVGYAIIEAAGGGGAKAPAPYRKTQRFFKRKG
jgi:hypothetical protein